MSKILIVCNYDFAFNKYMIPLANDLIKLGHEVGVACNGDNFENKLISKEIKFHNISMPRKISVKGFFTTILTLRNLIKINNYEVVNSNNRNASFLARIALIFLFSKKVKCVYTARGMYFHDSQRLIPYITSYWLEIFLLFFTDLVMSQSEQDAMKLSRNIFTNKNKFNVIHNGIDETRFSMNNVKELDIKMNGLVLSTIGRIVKEKGLMDLLEAFAIFREHRPNSSLLIIGGTLHDEHNKVLNDFWKFADQLKIRNHVFVTGMVDNVEDYLALSDIYIHPSYREGVPRSVLEAMALEKIVIASRIRGAIEIINNNKVGFLYKKGNINELVKQIIKVSNLTRGEVQSIGFASRERVLELYTQKKYLDRQLKAMKKVLS